MPDIEPARLPDVVIRGIRAADGAGLQAFHRGLSDETVRNRFFGAHPSLSDKEVVRFTSLVPGGELALVATVGDQIVAVGRYVPFGGGGAAEVAFVVTDDYQHHGIGRSLLKLLARLAWDDGIRRFVADTFASNRSMLGVFLHTPTAVTVLTTRRDGSVVHLVMQITRPSRLSTSISGTGPRSVYHVIPPSISD